MPCQSFNVKPEKVYSIIMATLEKSAFLNFIVGSVTGKDKDALSNNLHKGRTSQYLVPGRGTARQKNSRTRAPRRDINSF